jgi:hypothetical protein
MSENDLIDTETNGQVRRFRTEWLFPIFFQPRRTLGKVVSQAKAVWLLPILVLSLLALIYVGVQGGPRKANAQMGSTLPQNFQYYSQEQQDQMQQALDSQSGTSTVYVLPAIGTLAGIWLGWFLFGSLLHLSLTLAGSRSSNMSALNLAAWAGMPFALRFLVRIVYVLAKGQLIQSAGLSGFVVAGSGTMSIYLSALLSQVDLYMIWAFILALVGVLPLSSLTKGKAWWALLAAVVVTLLLAAVPGFLSALLGNFTSTGSF